jgi:two-component system sensor histidine kinase DesK
LLWAVWLLFLAQPVWTLLAAPPGTLRLAATLAGLALFSALYLALAWQNAARLTNTLAPAAATRTDWLAVSALAALGIAVTLLGTVNGTTLFEPLIFTSAFAAGRLPPRLAAVAVAALDVLAVAVGLASGVSSAALVAALAFISVVGVAVMALVRAIATEAELRAARGEISRLAAEAERLRIARDLHDLLGHNLSLMALKSELAGRLAAGAPERAASEMGDVERVARDTLQQVRQALAGYRQPVLADELRGAQEMLAAAGVAYAQQGEPPAGLPAPVDGLLAWTVREGVTNVIRHGRARRCTLRLSREAGWARIEITNDGETEAAVEAGAGSGLRGLAERAAALGGTCEAERLQGGFRLSVAAPEA